MQINQMRYALEVAKEKNFSAAAKNLYLSQPSLSQQIKNLEKELGVTLFVRYPRSVEVTDAGSYFIKSVQRILNEVDELTEHMKEYQTLQRGTIRIGMLWIAGYLNLSNVLTDYHEIHPQIDYSIKVEGSNKLMQMLAAREIKAAFVISSKRELQAQKELYYRKVMDDYYVAVISKKHPLSQKKTFSMKNIQGEKIIMPAKESAFYQELRKVFEKHYVEPEVLCETSQSDLVMQLAEKNMAIGFASHSIAKVLQTEELCLLPLNDQMRRSIYYVALKEGMDYPAVRSFTEFVEQYDFK